MLSHAAISGSPEEGIYAQTLISGNFYCVVFLKADLELGRNTVSKIEEIVSQSPQISPLELGQMIKEDIGEGAELALLIAFISGQKLILSAQGKVSAKLFRDGKIINLTAEKLSGNFLTGDLAIFGTEGLFSKLDLSEIAKLGDKSASEVNDIILPKIEEAGDGPSVAGLILKINLEPEKDPEPPEENETVEKVLEGPPTWAKKRTFPAVFGKLSKFVPSRKNILYLKQAREQGFEAPASKKTLYLAAIAFVILVSVIAFQLRSRSLELASENVDRIAKEVDLGIKSSGKLIGLNDQMARESLTAKKGEIVSLIEKDFGTEWKTSDSREGKRLREIVAKLDAEIARAAHINIVAKPEVYFDYSLLKPKPKISSAVLHDGKIIALDLENGSIFSLLTDGKSGSIVGGGNFGKNSKVDFSGDNLLVYTGGEVRKKDLTTNGAFKTVAKNATGSGEISAMSSFAGNVYLLDKAESQIWKLQGTEEGGFNSGVPYVQPGVELDLSGAKGMTIDGFIYVFDGDKIWKFASGAPEQFELKSLAAPISRIDSVFSSDQAKNIYIWDGESSRITVVNKEGLYLAQYQLPEIKNGASAIVLADEEQKKIFLISGEKVFGIGIK